MRKTHFYRYVIILFLAFILWPLTLSAKEEKCQKAVRVMKRLSDQESVLSSKQKEELFAEALTLCDRMPEIHHNYGIFLDSEGNTEKAREHFTRAYELDQRSDYQIAIARTHLEDKSYSKAETIFNNILDDNAENIKSLQGLAVISEAGGDVEGAIEYLQKALSFKPRDAVTHYNLAALFERQGSKADALTHYNKALESNSRHYPSLLRKGILSLQGGELRDAIRILEQAAEYNSEEDSKVFSALGAAYERLGKYPKAELSLRKALAYDESDLTVRANLALVLVKLDQPAQAVELFDEYKVDTEEDYGALGLIAKAMALQKLGKYDQAEKLFLKALKLQPKEPLVLTALSDFFEERGDSQKARKFRDKMKQIEK